MAETANLQIKVSSTGVTKATAELDKFTKTSSQTEKAVKKTENEFSKFTDSVTDATTATEKVKTELDGVTSKTEKTSVAISKLDNDVIDLAATLESAQREVKEFETQQVSLGRTVNKNGAVFDANGNVIRELSAEYLALKTKASDATSNLSTSAKKVATANEVLTKSSSVATSTLRNVGRSAGQAGIQVQQFVGQIQGGQSAMLALSQQSADLGFVLGAPLLGAVVGIGASLIGMALNAGVAEDALIDSAEAIDLLFKARERLNKQERETLKTALTEKLAEQKDVLKELRNELGLTENDLQAVALSGETFISSLFGVDQESASEKFENLSLNIIKISKDIEDTQSRIDKLDPTSATSDEAESLRDRLQKSQEAYTDELDAYFRSMDEFESKSATLLGTLKQQNIALQDGANAALEFRLAQSMGLADAKELPKAIRDELDARQNLLKVKQDELEADKQANALASTTESLKSQVIALEQGAQAAYEYQIAQQLGFESIEQAPEAIQNQIDKIFELRDAQSQLKETQEDITDSSLRMFESIQQNVVQGLGDATATALVDMENLGEGVKGVLRGAIKQAISLLVQLGVQRLIQSQMNITATTAEATASVAAGAAITSAMTPAAAAATVATGGTNLAAAAAQAPLFAGAFSTMLAAASTPIARASGGDLQGGQSSYIAENGLEVFAPNKNGRVFNKQDVQDMMQGGNKSSSTVFNVTTNQSFEHWFDNGGADKIERLINRSGDL